MVQISVWRFLNHELVDSKEDEMLRFQQIILAVLLFARHSTCWGLMIDGFWCVCGLLSMTLPGSLNVRFTSMADSPCSRHPASLTPIQPRYWGYRRQPPRMYLCGCWRCKLCSLRLHREQLNQWAIQYIQVTLRNSNFILLPIGVINVGQGSLEILKWR